MDKDNLSLGDVLNVMEFGQYAILTQGTDRKYSESGHPIMAVPSALYYDANDSGILKSTSNRQPIMVAKASNKGFTYRIVEEAEYIEYRDNYK